MQGVQGGPGQIDLVQHDGGNPSGEFCFTLIVTEVKHCWTVPYPLKNKAFRGVHQVLDRVLTALPLPVRILHADSGSEFINHALILWCQTMGIELVRSRTTKKNDNCYVKQKNYASVRKIVGYARFCGDKGIAALTEVYAHYNMLLNYFYLCQKLIARERVGSKVKKTYDKPQIPFDRILRDGEPPEGFKDKLISAKTAIDLIEAVAAMQNAIDKLPSLADLVPEVISKRHLRPLLFGSYGSILT